VGSHELGSHEVERVALSHQGRGGIRQPELEREGARHILPGGVTGAYQGLADPLTPLAWGGEDLLEGRRRDAAALHEQLA
jgi:hypothetical protein